MSRQRVDELQGDVRFHHLIRGQLQVLDARDCANRWKVFHSTYSFCLVVRLEPCVVEWIYDGRVYRVDPDHRIMLMQPGETHANLTHTPRADFIVVHVGEELMRIVANDLGWRGGSINVRHPHQQSQHPELLRALRQFHSGLCPTLFAPGAAGGQCTCHERLDLHLGHLVQLVAVFLRYCADGARPLPPARSSRAFIAGVSQHLLNNFRQPYCVGDVLREAAPTSSYDESYLLHEFKKTYGVSPGDFQNMILAALTRDAVAATPRKLFSRIVSEVGWPGRGEEASDRVRAAHKHFKRTYGTTPGRFARGSLRASALEAVLVRLTLVARGSGGPSDGGDER